MHALHERPVCLEILERYLLTKTRDGGQGFGFLESVYKKAMALELRKQNMVVKEEQPLKVYYEKTVVGEFFVDLFVENEIIIELKSIENLSKAHEVQLVNYLNGMKKDIGLLINFGPNGVDIKRKYRKPEKV